jgi:hypothetical protein
MRLKQILWHLPTKTTGMKNLNWGWRIVILYVAFVVFMLAMVIKTTTVKDVLVTPDYYAKELQYQQRLDRLKNSHALEQQPAWQVSKDVVVILFPDKQAAQQVKAEILFYNTAEAKKDIKINCLPDSTGLCLVDAKQLQHGAYKLHIDWSAGGVDYYNEGIINIQ